MSMAATAQSMELVKVQASNLPFVWCRILNAWFSPTFNRFASAAHGATFTSYNQPIQDHENIHYRLC
jgi:hypothetical protein